MREYKAQCGEVHLYFTLPTLNWTSLNTKLGVPILTEQFKRGQIPTHYHMPIHIITVSLSPRTTHVGRQEPHISGQELQVSSRAAITTGQVYITIKHI